MAITTRPQMASVEGAGTVQPVAGGAIGTETAGPAERVTSEQVWRALARASFAVVSHVTPTGAPRCSGVVYTTVDRRLYVAVAPDSWKARHIARSGQVAVTVPVRRGGVLTLLFPIPPATITFHATATVHLAGSTESPAVARARKQLEPLLPEEGRASSSVVEIIPEDQFLTYGVGVPLMQMRSPTAAMAHVPVR